MDRDELNLINTEQDLCYQIPKAELHIHIEGTFEPELIYEIAKRNSINLKESIEELKAKYEFNNLGEFLDIYYMACSVLIKEEDFSDLMYEYIKKASKQGLVYAEIFFDPQTHTQRGITFETVINGLTKGMERGRLNFGVETNLCMCFVRHLSEEDCINTFNESLPFKDKIMACGLDSYEVGNPPEKFENLFRMAKENGFRLTAHAGEEAPYKYIESSLDLLKVERIDHGFQSINSEELMIRLMNEKIPLTMCPLSNKKLKVCPDLSKYPIRILMSNNIIVTINSDDPAYFGGYIGDNYYSLCRAIGLTKEEIITFAKNSFIATFLTQDRKDYYLQKINDFINNH
jgi:adenosine deaminase